MEKARNILLLLVLTLFMTMIFADDKVAGSAMVTQSVADGMVFIEGGTFNMGDTVGGGFKDEKLIHQVKLNSFYMSKYELTQAEWKKVMENQPANNYGISDNNPVYNVSWYDAIEYCNKRSELEGLIKVYSYTKNGDNDLSNVIMNKNADGYRLPTEAEWEYAAKGGKKSAVTNGGLPFKYSGSNNAEDVAWYDRNSDSKTHEIGTKQANELGIFDMSGNVWEWCWDWMGTYSSLNIDNPIGNISGTTRIIRGGSWSDSKKDIRSSGRGDNEPNGRLSAVGIRVVRTQHVF